jgi:hypothetical protein
VLERSGEMSAKIKVQPEGPIAND